jgi:hypothetical protein
MIASLRTIVYTICRLVEVANMGTGVTVDDWWVDCTVGGSAQIAAIKAARDGAGNATKTSVVQYHVYYADGGHVRYKERYYLIEEASTAVDVSLRPDPLVPTPELLPV